MSELELDRMPLPEELKLTRSCPLLYAVRDW
jgi:hypothetical protein